MPSLSGARVLMLLDNPCAPDVRVLREGAALHRAGAEVRVVCWDREGRVPVEEHRDGITLQRVRTPSGRQMGLRQLATLRRFYREARRLVRPDSYDVVHAHDLLMLPLGASLARRGRVPLIYDAHEIYHIMEGTRYPSPVLNGIAWMERRLIRRSVDAFITVSEQRVADYWRPVLAGREAFVVGNWYDPVSVPDRRRAEARAAWGIPDSALCLAYAGGLTGERRLDLILRAAQRLPEQFFLVAGRGDPQIEQRLLEAATARPNLRYLGWTDDPDRVYDAADVLYYLLDPDHPYSRFAASNTLHIAIARALPLITGDVGEPGRVMAGVDPSLVLSPATTDRLVEALKHLSDQGRYQEARQGMRAAQGRFSWRQSEEALRRAYAAAGFDGIAAPSAPRSQDSST